MQILHFSDLHLDTPFSSSHLSPKIATGCRLRLRRTLLRLFNLAAEHDVDVVTIGGDLFEGDRVNRDTLKFIARCFEQIKPTPILIAPGNHDYFSPVSAYARYEWPDNVFIFHEDHLEPLELSEDIIIWGFAHTAPDVKKNPLENVRLPEGDRIHLLLMHGSATGLIREDRAQYAPFQPQDIAAAGFTYGLLGHYHNARVLTGEGELGVYPGSPQPLNFGEVGKHGVALVRIENGELQCRIALTETQKFVDFGFIVPAEIPDTHALGEEIAKAAPPRAEEANFLRITLKGMPDTDLQLQPELLREQLEQLFDYVEIHNEIQSAANLDEIAREPTVRGAFVRRMQRMMAEENEDPGMARLALQYGLQAFEGENPITP